MLRPKVITAVITAYLQPKVPDKVQDKRKQIKTLPQIKKDDTVCIRKGKFWEPAVVKSVHPAPRSFIVTHQDGGDYRRNRRHL